jgi:PhnB protein
MPKIASESIELGAGARSLQEPTDQFYGDRNARFEDPFGNEWS